MDAVRAERVGPVQVLTLDKPERSNAFDAPMAEELHAKVRAAARDGSVRCLLLTATGKAFCAGGDAKAMRAAQERGQAPELFASLTEHLHPTVRLLHTMPKPTLCAVNGAVAGGGYGLALACDLRLGSEHARFKTAYLALGVVPDGGVTWLLPRIVGPARARELLLLDEAVDAPRALELGLLHRVVPADELGVQALAVAERLAALPQAAAARTKQLLAERPARSLAAQLGLERKWNRASAGEADFAEGLRAFGEKRAPRFG
ncbi:MAG: enoyl-CoA hydratase/isomerase family protein [Halobacteriales archaeon]|nr:enoyl-CoA hydratase/isomerase family protein [Halobacteriales archaeon]